MGVGVSYLKLNPDWYGYQSGGWWVSISKVKKIQVDFNEEKQAKNFAITDIAIKHFT